MPESIIGADEAGYGPNLGPLVVSATLWHVPPGVQADQLYDRLNHVIVPTPGQAGAAAKARVAMADSKTLYVPGGSLRNLERGLFAAWAALGKVPWKWTDLWELLAPDSAAVHQAIPWYAHCDLSVPLDADPAELPALGAALRDGTASAGVRLAKLVSRAVFPEQFNQLLQKHGSKAEVLSYLTLERLREVVEPLGEGPISITCDKHGGRNRYARLLDEHFPESFIEICGESRRRSVYRFGPAERRVEFCFRTRGESCLPVALASMASKYLRELAMRAFNAFWSRRVPELKPTAGYPQDAKRFMAAIAAAQADLGIRDEMLWRRR